MSNLIINRSSSKYAVLSLGIALFLLAFLFTCLFVGHKFTPNSSGSTTAIYELKDGHPANTLDLILHEVQDLSNIRASSYELISKSGAFKYFEDELDAKSLKEIQRKNPFQDIVTIDFNSELSTVQIQALRQVKLKFDNFITKVGVNSYGSQFNWVSGGLTMVLLPFILVSSLFCLIIVMGALNNDLVLNQLEIKKSIIAGVDPKVLYKNMRSSSLSSFLKAVVVAIVLYFVTFYLISHYLNVNFSEFGYYIFLKPIFASILFVFLCLLIVTHYKVSNFLKSI